MSRELQTKSTPQATAVAAVLAILVSLVAGCKGDTGDTGSAGATTVVPGGSSGTGGTTPIRTALEPSESLPGVSLQIVSLSGATGATGNFQVGDSVKVTFTIKTKPTTSQIARAIPIGEIDSSEVMISGPTENYQRVITGQSNLITSSTLNEDGSYTYAFPAIPTGYAAPLNDSTSFGAADGELAGQPIRDGTYTVGMRVYKSYFVGPRSFRDVGIATKDFLIGTSASTISHREVVKTENCNNCHGTLQAHGGSRRTVEYCLLCHNAGSEDRNKSSVAGGTPGVSIDFKVMIHKIHNAKHLPSVVGVATDPTTGDRIFTATPTAYDIVGYGDRILDFSGFGFPVMPSAYFAQLFDKTGLTDGTHYIGPAGNGPMPRDIGYKDLSGDAKIRDDKVRAGVVACDKCHGDPDGSGSLAAPAQGGQAYSVPSKAACGSCHDDVNWAGKYKSNGETMPAGVDDAACINCHKASGAAVAGAISSKEAHVHPYSNSTLNTGVKLAVTSVSGGTGPGGNFKAGDPIRVSFTLKDNAGTALSLASMTRFQVIVNGPVANPGLVLPAIQPYDTGFRKGSNTGSGSASTPSIASGATAQTVQVIFTSPTAFDVKGTVSAALTNNAIATTTGSAATITNYGGITFTVTQGSTAFAAEDRFFFEVVPTGTMTMNVPMDIVYERLGAVATGTDVLSVTNTPLYLGRVTVYEETAPRTGTPATLQEAAKAYGRYVLVTKADVTNIAVNDRVVLHDANGTEEYVDVGRIQDKDDVTGQAFGSGLLVRLWFKNSLRYDHATTATVQEVTFSTKKEGTHYTVSGVGYNDASGTAASITLVSGFTVGNVVVASYRTHGRFGWKRAPGDSLQAVYPAAAADSDDIDITAGDWKGLPFADGTYTVGMWAHKDFAVTTAGVKTTPAKFDPTQAIPPDYMKVDDTLYRMITEPANKSFLYGLATTIEKRAIISAGSNCNACHDDIQAHGNGRRGLETCLLCHAVPGMEDAPLYSYSAWKGIGATPGAGMQFRQLLHKVHKGKELENALTYEVNGVHLGVPYPVTYEDAGFSMMPGGVKHCDKCHGAGNTAEFDPPERQPPTPENYFLPPAKTWGIVCGSCHDSDAVRAHIDINTTVDATSGVEIEACATCHGIGAELGADIMHKNR